MGNRKPSPREVRERAVRMVREHGHDHDSQWARINAIADKVGMTAETLRKVGLPGGDRWREASGRDEG
jgi:transposase-like protein